MISKTLDFIIEYTTVKKEMDINKEPSCKVSESNLWFYTEDSGNTFQNSTFEYDNEMDTDEGVSKNREMDNEDAKQTHMYSVNNNDGNETSDAQEENQDNKKGTFKQLLKDKESRRKVFRTFFMLCLYPIFGWIYGIMGPTLPDLQLITASSLQQMSWLFVGFQIGYLFSCVSSGFVHGKVNPDILVFLYTAGHALSMGALPWLPNIYGMVAVRCAQGYCCGAQDIELTPMLFSVWHDKAGPFVQMTHLLYGIGGIVSPLVAKPFLIKVSKYLSAQTATTDDFAANSSVTNWQPNCSTGKETMVDMDNASIIVRCNSTAGFDKYTRVHFAYLIGALLMASAALPFLIFYTQGKVKEQAGDSQTQTEQSTKVFGKPRIFIVISLLTIVHGVGMALTDAFPIFLATFGILHLEWSQSMGSSMTALYFASYAVGSFMGVFILKFISSRSYVYLTYITSIGSVILFYVGIHWAISPLQTIPIAAIGIATSAIMPTVFTWTQEAITPVSGIISSAFYFSGSVASLLNPILFAYLIESITPMWFIYATIVEILLCFALCIIGDIIIRIRKF